MGNGRRKRGLRPAPNRFSQAFNDTSGGKVECRAIMCGISLLCCTSAKTSEKMSFAFAIFDKNADESLTKEEIAEFFDLFRGPVFTVVERSMSNFYETCGFEDDFREIVQDLVDGSLKRHIVAIVKDAVESVRPAPSPSFFLSYQGYSMLDYALSS